MINGSYRDIEFAMQVAQGREFTGVRKTGRWVVTNARSEGPRRRFLACQRGKRVS